MSWLGPLVVALHLSFGAPPELEVMPVFHQGGVLVSGGDVTAGGLGGGLGVQLVVDRRWLAQADVGLLWLMGQAWLARVAVGVQRDAPWSPAGWLTLQTLWGDRVEHIGPDALRPPIPTWGLGLRASLLRFGGASGVVSALELGVATDFAGGLWLEITLLQAGARW